MSQGVYRGRRKTIKFNVFNPSDKMMKYVDFTRFCVNQGIEAYDVAHLIHLAHRAFKAGERYSNDGSIKSSRVSAAARDQFEIKAYVLKFGVSWYGLWPTLCKDGHDIELPSF